MIIKSKIILVDCDGVLLYWLDAFNRFMAHQGFFTTNPGHFTLPEHYGLSENDMNDYINRFNMGHWEFGTLPPYADAQYGVKSLHDMGYKFVVITSCSTHPQAIALRKANLYHHFGDVFDSVHCIDLHDTKKTHLAEYEPTYWIEDNPKNAEDGLIYNHNCILMLHSWNKNFKNNKIKIVSNWAEIVEYIIQNDDIK